MSNQIKIYVADLAAYNAGHLHGVWINACQDIEDIQDQINEMLKNSPVVGAEEYAIHDDEGFEGYSLGESSIRFAHEAACLIAEYPEFGGSLLSHFSDIDEARECAEENYGGCYKSLADYAQEQAQESIEIPQQLQYYIDFDAMGRDMELNGDIFIIEAGFQEVHIFWGH